LNNSVILNNWNIFIEEGVEISAKKVFFFIHLACLESLSISKTKITAIYLSKLLNNQSQKVVFLDSEENELNI
jgi:hypothetical protein